MEGNTGRWEGMFPFSIFVAWEICCCIKMCRSCSAFLVISPGFKNTSLLGWRRTLDILILGSTIGVCWVALVSCKYLQSWTWYRGLTAYGFVEEVVLFMYSVLSGWRRVPFTADSCIPPPVKGDFGIGEMGVAGRGREVSMFRAFSMSSNSFNALFSSSYKVESKWITYIGQWRLRCHAQNLRQSVLGGRGSGSLQICLWGFGSALLPGLRSFAGGVLLVVPALSLSVAIIVSFARTLWGSWSGVVAAIPAWVTARGPLRAGVATMAIAWMVSGVTISVAIVSSAPAWSSVIGPRSVRVSGGARMASMTWWHD